MKLDVLLSVKGIQCLRKVSPFRHKIWDITQCVNPDVILRWTWFEKTIAMLFAIVTLITIPFSLWNTITNDTPFITKALMIAFFIYICHCIYIGFNIYKARLEEQAEWGVQ